MRMKLRSFRVIPIMMLHTIMANNDVEVIHSILKGMDGILPYIIDGIIADRIVTNAILATTLLINVVMDIFSNCFIKSNLDIWATNAINIDM